jgi:tetratricopeptide (TPR) repeat protein
MKCLEREPLERPRDGQQFLEMLEAVEREPCGLEFEGARVESTPGADAPPAITSDWSPITAPVPGADLPSRSGWLPKQARWWLLAGLLVSVLVGVLSTAAGAPVRRQLCRQLPGTAMFCDLPPDKDIAVFPFRIQANQNSPDHALAVGLARHVRESFHRLAPDPAALCVHLRTDRLSDSVQLVLEGAVQVDAASVTLRMSIRENSAADGAPLLLRSIERTWNRQDPAGLYREPLEELASALEVRFPEQEWRAWSRSAPRRAASVAYYLEGLGRLEAGQAEAAATAFTEAIDPARSFDFALGHVGLGDAYRLQYNKTRDRSWEVRARQAYRRAVPLDREFGLTGTEISLGDLDAAAGNTDGAISHYQAALKLWPYDHPLQKKLAAVYEAAGRLEDAVAVSGRARGWRRIAGCPSTRWPGSIPGTGACAIPNGRCWNWSAAFRITEAPTTTSP